jgi:hypothetical protein
MAALRASNLNVVTSGSNVSAIPFAGTLMLVAIKAANLPNVPERPPKEDTYSGYLAVAAVTPGVYSVSLSDAAWVDVLQHDRFLKAKAHSRVQGCQGIRKVIQFDLASEPFIVQLSGAPTDRLTVAIMGNE